MANNGYFNFVNSKNKLKLPNLNKSALVGNTASDQDKGFFGWLVSQLGSDASKTPATTAPQYGATMQTTTDLSSAVVTPLSGGGTVPESSAVAESTALPETGTTMADIGAEYEKFLREQKDIAYKKAQSAYEAESIDAERGYQRYVNPYGAEQERIADSGLAGSGFAKYLNDRAYSAMVSEKQAALGRKAAAELAADEAFSTKYGEYILNKKTNEAQAKMTLQDSYGLGADDTIFAIDSLVASGTISGADKVAYIDDFVKNQEAGLANGSIYYGSDGGITTYKNAQDILSSTERVFGKDSQQYKDAEAGFNKIYGVKTIHGFGDPNQKQLGVDATEFGRANVGDKVNVWWGKIKFKVEKGEEVTDSNVIKAARTKNFPEGAYVFGLNGQIYIHYNGKVYSVNERNKNAYEDLKALLFSGQNGIGTRIFVNENGDRSYKDQNNKVYRLRNDNRNYVDEAGNWYTAKFKNGRIYELVPQ